MTRKVYTDITLQEALGILRERLRELGDPPVSFIGQRGTDAYGLKRVLDQVDYPLYQVICLDYSRELETIAPEIVSLEKFLQQRNKWYSSSLGNLFRAGKISLPRESLLFCYSSIGEIEPYCREKRVRVIGNRYGVQQMFSDKIGLSRLLAEAGMPVACSVIRPLKSVCLKALKSMLDSEILVFQTPFGSSGTGTFMVRGEEELAMLRAMFCPNAPFKIARFVSGYSYAITGFVSPESLHWCPPALQVIGNDIVGRLSLSKTTYSGSDFFVSREIAEKHVDWDLFQRLALKLRQHGFMGIFNIDVLARGSYVVDLNPRCPGSIRIITELSLANGEIPLLLLQLLAYLGCEIVNRQKVQRYDDAASLLVMHCLNKNVRKLENSVQSGVYGRRNGRVSYVKDGVALGDFSGEEILVTGGIPESGVDVCPDAPMGRIWLKKRIVTGDMVLERGVLDLVGKVYGNFGF